MKVALLGTSSAEGWPALFCGCEACGKARKLGGKNIRTRCSALVDDRLKIDLPPDIHSQVIQNGLDLRCLSAVLFTHAHDDHCAAAELQYRGHYFVPRPFSDRLNIYGSESVMQEILNRLAPENGVLDFDKYPLNLNAVCAETDFRVGDHTITAINAMHDESQQCFNFIIQDDAGATLLYATDTGWYCEETWAYLESRKLDAVVVEASNGFQEDGYAGHLSFAQVVKLRERLLGCGALLRDAPVVTTHVSHLCGIMHQEMEALLSPHGITPGYDGMILHI